MLLNLTYSFAEILEEEAKAPDDGIVAEYGVLLLGDVVDDEDEQRADQHEAQYRADPVRQYAQYTFHPCSP